MNRPPDRREAHELRTRQEAGDHSGVISKLLVQYTSLSPAGNVLVLPALGWSTPRSTLNPQQEV